MSEPASRPAERLHARLVDDLVELQPYLARWDELAVAAGRPFCAPAWMLAWWREGRTGDARLRVVLVFDEHDRVVAVAPFFAQIGPLGVAEYRLLAAGFCHRIGILAEPDTGGGAGPGAVSARRRIAAELAAALAAARPRPDSVVFEGIDETDPWPDLLAQGWPGRRATTRLDFVLGAPVIALSGDFASWLARRDRRFRKEARRNARRLEAVGVVPRIASDPAAVRTLIELHHARWRDRGGSSLDDAAGRVVVGAARCFPGGDAPPEDRRIEIVLLTGPDGAISAELMLRAGRTVAFWTGGLKPAWSTYSPGTQAMLAGLEHVAGQGIDLGDLGGGVAAYKQRLADADHPVVWRTVFPPGPRYLLIRARLAPKHARLWLRERVRRLPADWQRRLHRGARGG